MLQDQAFIDSQINKLKEEESQQINQFGSSTSLTKAQKNSRNARYTKKIDITQQEHGIPYDSFKDSDFFFQDGIFRHKFIVSLKSGLMFGELGILMNKPRAASIVAKSTTDLGVMDKNDYYQILQSLELKKMEKKLDFFKKNFFQEVTKEDSVLKYSYNFKKLNLLRGSYIYKEGDKANFIYLIKKGEVESTKQILQHKNNEQQVKLLKLQNNFTQQGLYCLSEGQIFGEQEIFDKNNRQYSMKVKSNKATLYYLEANIFMKILNENQKLKNKFLEFGKLRRNWNDSVDRQTFQFPIEKQKQKSSMNQVEDQIKQKIILGQHYLERKGKYEENLQQYLVNRRINSTKSFINLYKIQRKLKIVQRKFEDTKDIFQLMNKNDKEARKQDKKLKMNQAVVQIESNAAESNMKLFKGKLAKTLNKIHNMKRMSKTMIQHQSEEVSVQNNVSVINDYRIQQTQCFLSKNSTFNYKLNNISENNSIEEIKNYSIYPCKIIQSKHNQFRPKPNKSVLLYKYKKKIINHETY